MKATHSLLALAMFAAHAAFAAGSADAVEVFNPYVRAMPPGARATAAFMTLKNTGSADARLVKAESGAARQVQLHSHFDNKGVMEMREVAGIDVKGGGQTELKPGGYHVMLIGPTANLKPGDSVKLTLQFADGSSKRVDAPVKMPEAMPTAGHEHMQH